MARKDNLIPQAHKLTVEEQSIGGKKSAEVRRKKATVKEIFQQLLNSNLNEQQKRQLLSQFSELTDESISYKTAIGIKQLDKAVKGDINAAKFMFDYAGEKPVENVDTEVKLPVTNITVIDNKELKKKFEEYELNT